MAASLVWKLMRTWVLVSPLPFQPVSGSGRCASCRSNSSSQRPALALPDWVVLRSSSEMRATVIAAEVAKCGPGIKEHHSDEARLDLSVGGADAGSSGQECLG